MLSFRGTSLLSLVRKYYPPPAPSQQNRFSSSICFDIKVKTLLRPKTETLIFNHTFFKGQEIAPAEKAKKSKTSKGAEYVYSKLGIGNATEDDSGEYVCVVENHSGQNNNVSVEIKVWTGECVSQNVRNTRLLARMTRPLQYSDVEDVYAYYLVLSGMPANFPLFPPDIKDMRKSKLWLT